MKTPVVRYACGLVICVLALAAENFAQDKPLKKIRWAQTSVSTSQSIPWIAKEANFYEQNGLDVEIIPLKGGSGQAADELAKGNIFAAPVTTITVMMFNLDGANLATIADSLKTIQTKVVARPELKKPEDIKGKRLASSGFGTVGDFLQRVVIKKHGLNPDGDVIWVPFGNLVDRLNALVSGSVDAADLSYPADAQAERKGYRVLWDLRKEVVYPAASIVTRRKSIQEDRDIVMRLVKSHMEAIAYFKMHKDSSLKVLSKYLQSNDRELLEGSYELYKQDFISVPYPIVNDLAVAYDYVATTKPEIRGRKPEEFMDPSFIAELDKSGFIKKLYEQK